MEIDEGAKAPSNIFARCGMESEWISVKDRLPEDKQMIAACIDRIQMGCICRYSENEVEKLPCLKYGPLSILGISWKEITHWIPLPQTPKE